MKLPVYVGAFGAMRNPSFHPVDLLAAALDPVTSARDWYREAVPTYSQKFPSCVGHSTANWVEMMLRAEAGDGILAKGQQIDGDAIWRRGREMFNGGDMDGGLLMHQGFLAAVDLGILPEGSAPVALEATPAAVARQLLATPVLQGTCVHRGWEDPNPENGQIPFLLPDPFAGHATCIVSVTSQAGDSFLAFQNSWGATWGRYGFGLLRADQWAQCLLDAPVTCQLTWKLSEHEGWRKYVIGTP